MKHKSEDFKIAAGQRKDIDFLPTKNLSQNESEQVLEYQEERGDDASKFCEIFWTARPGRHRYRRLGTEKTSQIQRTRQGQGISLSPTAWWIQGVSRRRVSNEL